EELQRDVQERAGGDRGGGSEGCGSDCARARAAADSRQDAVQRCAPAVPGMSGGGDVRVRGALAVVVTAALWAQSRLVRWEDLPAGIARRFERAEFDERMRAIERDTERRERAGELEHLIYYALQSQRFTKLPRIEPALSAREYVQEDAVPAEVEKR